MVERAMTLAGLYGCAGSDRSQNVIACLLHRLAQRQTQGQMGGNGRRQGATSTVNIAAGNAFCAVKRLTSDPCACVVVLDSEFAKKRGGIHSSKGLPCKGSPSNHAFYVLGVLFLKLMLVLHVLLWRLARHTLKG